MLSATPLMYPQQIEAIPRQRADSLIPTPEHSWLPTLRLSNPMSLSLSFIAFLFLSLTLLSQFLSFMSLFGSFFWLHYPGKNVQAQDEARPAKNIHTGSREQHHIAASQPLCSADNVYYSISATVLFSLSLALSHSLHL